MKKHRFATYIILVFLIVACVDVVFSLIIDGTTKGSFNQKIDWTRQKDADVAIIGASRASHHYNPKIFEDSLGLNAINYGIDGRNIYVHYAVLKSLIAHSMKPSTVILDVSGVDEYDMPGFNKERISILHPYVNDTTVSEILEDLMDPAELAFVRMSGLVRHNSGLLQYIKENANKNDDGKGYVPLFNTWNYELEERAEAMKEDPEKLRYIKKFIATCKENDIDLIIVKSPLYSKSSSRDGRDAIERISLQMGATYFDFEGDTLFLAHREWFSDPDHLNHEGATQFSNMIIKKMKVLESNKTAKKANNP
ncbi:MAG: hypothetical protein J1F07_03495 [Muribaculaceae bacterium]|nr:hypothetical protein [Muribaculaceae bacterium]